MSDNKTVRADSLKVGDVVKTPLRQIRIAKIHIANGLVFCNTGLDASSRLDYYADSQVELAFTFD